MRPKLAEIFPVETAVEMLQRDLGWVHGTVIRHQFPGVWVRTRNGQTWFVTNRQRIRHQVQDAGVENDEG